MSYSILIRVDKNCVIMYIITSNIFKIQELSMLVNSHLTNNYSVVEMKCNRAFHSLQIGN